MHPVKLNFLRAINADPRNRETQLIFADWLEDHDDPQAHFWRGGRVGRGGLVGHGGHGGLSGLGGLGGRGGRGGLFNPEAPIVLIPGENALIFIPHGYGFSVLVGHVAKDLPTGWIVDPCREVIDTKNGDCWVALARGDKALRKACQYGELIEGGMRVPLGCMSMVWQGQLPS